MKKLRKFENTKKFIIEKWEYSRDFRDHAAGEVVEIIGGEVECRRSGMNNKARSLSPTSRLLEEDTLPSDEDSSPLMKELKKYEIMERISSDGCRMQFWKKNEEELPVLSVIAKEILSILCSSSKSERVFSTSGQVKDI